jgi:hypothetical protein
MLKTMLRVFEKRIIRIFRLKSISWVAFSLSFRRKARDVCVCVCLCAWRRKMRMKNVAFEKNLFFVEFKDFYFLRSILELIIRSFVNIKRREEKFTSLTEFRNSSLHLRFKLQKVHSTRYYTFSDLRLFYLILISCAAQLFKIRWILFSSRVLFFWSRHQHDHFK